MRGKKGMGQEDVLADKLDRLKRKFADELKVKAEALREALRAGEASGWGQGELDELQRLARGLVGTAGSLGFREVSDKADDLEHDVSCLMEGKSPRASFRFAVAYKGTRLLTSMTEAKAPVTPRFPA